MTELYEEVWSYALDRLDADSEGFVIEDEALTKPPEFHLPLASAVLYANTG